MATDTYSIGPGFRQAIQDNKLTPLGDEVYFSPQYSMVLTDVGALFYSKATNTVVVPKDLAPS
jgi:hypothetical protein